MGASAKTDEKFEIDDLIVAVGMTTTEHGVENQHHVLAKIVVFTIKPPKIPMKRHCNSCPFC